MPKRVKPNEEQLLEIRRRVREHQTYTSIARWLGCCTDTLRRILQRHGIADFQGAKYQVKRKHFLKTWKRPCLICKDAKTRPKNQYICDRCKLRQARQRIEGGIDDLMYSLSTSLGSDKW